MPYTLMTAAQACGINRSTVLRAIKSGKISATKDELTGAWLIEPAEMHRIYPPVAVPDARSVAMPERAQGDSVDALVAELRTVIADLRRDRDKLHAALEREQANHAATQSRLLPAPVAARWRWWRRAAG